MEKKDILDQIDLLHKNIELWFVLEMTKWSKKHNMHVEDYTILRMWKIDDKENESHEPYRDYRDKDLDEKYAPALKDLEVILDGLSEFRFNYQAYRFDEETQMIY